jgi:prolyl oligopeptidase
VRSENAKSVAALTGTEKFLALESRLLSILDSKEKIPFVRKIGSEFFYNFWKDGANPKGLLRRCTPSEFAKQEPNWEVVLDLDALSAAEGENWVYHGSTVLEPEGELCLLKLSRGGADADVVREFNLLSKSFVAGGFYLPEAKSHVSWRHRDSLFIATDLNEVDSLTTSGYPAQVRVWNRGEPLSPASTSLVYACPTREDMEVSGWADRTPGYYREFVSRQITFYSDELFLCQSTAVESSGSSSGSSGEAGEGVKEAETRRLVRVEKPIDAKASVHRDWLLLELRSDWEVILQYAVLYNMCVCISLHMCVLH